MSYQKRRYNTRKRNVYVPHNIRNGSRPSGVTVVARDGEWPEKLIKRFLKKCKKERILEDYRERRFFESNSEKRHKANKRKKRLIEKDRLKALEEKRLQEIEANSVSA